MSGFLVTAQGSQTDSTAPARTEDTLEARQHGVSLR